METTTLNLNLSLNYCNDWTPLMIVRELFANAHDANPTDCSVDSIQNRLIIYNGVSYDENNEPVTLHPIHWTMGVHDNPLEGSIGRFGEGQKVAITAALRMGQTDIRIRSGHYMFKPFAKRIAVNGGSATKRVKQVEQDNRVTHMSVEWREDFFDGTQIIIEDWEHGAFREIFLSMNDSTLLWQDREYALVDEEVAYLYLSGIRIATMESIFGKPFRYGYSLPGDAVKLNRDREQPSPHDVRNGIAKMLSCIDDPNIWALLWRVMKEEEAGERGVNWKYWDYYDAREAFMAGFYEVYGTNVCVSRDNLWSTNIEHEGSYVPVRFWKGMEELLIKWGVPTDETIHELIMQDRDAEFLNLDQVQFDPNQSRTFRMLKVRIEKYAKELEEKPFQIECRMLGFDDDAEFVEYRHSDSIEALTYISPQVILDRKAAFKVLVEICVYHWYGKGPNDWGFDRRLLEFIAILLENRV